MTLTPFHHMLRNINIFLLLLLGGIPSLCFAQNDQSTSRNLEEYKKNHEFKLYMHTDRQQYFAGEDMWFKLYNLKNDSFKKSEKSEIVFVEVFNTDKIPVLQAKVQLVKGVGSSSLYLPANMPSGNYLLRAYTASVLKYRNPSLFEKEVRILNVRDGLNSSRVANTSVKYDFQIFPEGGEIVEGIPTKLAFKLTNSFGNGVDFNGVILDQEGNIVKEIKSLKFGIGASNFAPMENKRYKVKIYLKDGAIVDKNLPVSLKSGYVLNVARMEGKRIRVRVFGSKDLNGKSTQLMVYSKSGQIIVQEKAIINANAPQEVFIAEEKLEDGISMITLLDAQGIPVAERLVFKQPKSGVTVKVERKNEVYQKRKKVELDLSLAGLDNDLPLSDFSIAVYKNDTLSYDCLNIKSYLLFSSELKGKIEGVDYYADENGPDNTEAIDNLMLTHGWRRFNREREEETTIPKPEFSYGQLIQGKITNKKGEPVRGTLAYLTVPGKDNRLFVAKTDDKGIASFDVKNYYGAGELVLQTDDAMRAEYELEILTPFYKATPSFPLKEIDYTKINDLNYLDNGIAVQVESSFKQAEKNNFSVPVLDTIPFYFKADRKFNLDDYTRFRTMEEVLREYISGSILRKTGNNYHLYLLDANRGYHFDKQPLILFNGVPAFNTDKIIAYDPLKVKSIELVYKRYYYGPLISDGIVNFKTYDSTAPELEMDPKALSLSYGGLQATKEFYTPVYELPAQITDRTPDFRTLLYWNPSVKTDRNGKAVIKFYTSDRTGTFKIVMDGVAENGKLISGSTSFKVN